MFVVEVAHCFLKMCSTKPSYVVQTEAPQYNKLITLNFHVSSRTAGMSVDLCPLSLPVGYMVVHLGCWAPLLWSVTACLYLLTLAVLDNCLSFLPVHNDRVYNIYKKPLSSNGVTLLCVCVATV